MRWRHDGAVSVADAGAGGGPDVRAAHDRHERPRSGRFDDAAGAGRLFHANHDCNRVGVSRHHGFCYEQRDATVVLAGARRRRFSASACERDRPRPRGCQRSGRPVFVYGPYAGKLPRRCVGRRDARPIVSTGRPECVVVVRSCLLRRHAAGAGVANHCRSGDLNRRRGDHVQRLGFFVRIPSRRSLRLRHFRAGIWAIAAQPKASNKRWFLQAGAHRYLTSSRASSRDSRNRHLGGGPSTSLGMTRRGRHAA